MELNDTGHCLHSARGACKGHERRISALVFNHEGNVCEINMCFNTGVYPQNFEWSGVLVCGNFRMAIPTFLISKVMLV